jgi:Zn-dependent protease with chaperone function
MKRPTICGRLLLLILTVTTLAGCLHNSSWRSAYQTAYVDRLAGVEVPADDDIRGSSIQEDDQLAQPAAKVWESFLTLASQSCSLLGVRDDPGGGHRALVAAYHSVRGFDYLVDRWLAISVQPVADRLTRVSIALVSPETARVASLASDRAPVNRERNRSLGLAASADLLLAINQSFAEPAYLRRIGEAKPGAPRAPGSRPKIEDDPTADLLVERHANFASALYRRESFVLPFPELERRLTDIAHRLAAAAGHPGDEIRVYLVVDRELDPHIEANGDLFLTTGTLDAVASVDELAGIMAHEMAHFYLHHGRTRSRGVRAAFLSQSSVAMAAELGGFTFGVILPEIPKSPAPKDTLWTSKQLLVGTVVAIATVSGAVYFGAAAGTGLARAEIHHFSQAEELAADDYGTELLWRAGFDYRGLLTLLQRVGRGLDHAQ